jgi:hypothetical protein
MEINLKNIQSEVLPDYWIRSNKGATKIANMDDKHIHTAMTIVKSNTKTPNDKFGAFTRKQWISAFVNELNRRDELGRTILVTLFKKDKIGVLGLPINQLTIK